MSIVRKKKAMKREIKRWHMLSLVRISNIFFMHEKNVEIERILETWRYLHTNIQSFFPTIQSIRLQLNLIN